MNALLTIRDMVEQRLWELCEQRFTIVPPGVALKEMDPVDLVLPHGRRLHSFLARMVGMTQKAEKEATYSLILHGPPGSSKTTIASALAQEMWKGGRRWGKEGHRLIRVTPADFTRMGEDRVDSEAQLIFRLLSHVRGVTILFDEIDDLLRRRDFATKERARFLDLVTPAMLNRLQDLHDVCERQEICFLFGTNYVEKIEPALMRQGRIDKRLPVVYPDFESRRALAHKSFQKVRETGDATRLPDLDLCASVIAEICRGWPWSAYTSLCKRWAREVPAVLAELARKGSADKLVGAGATAGSGAPPDAGRSQSEDPREKAVRKHFDDWMATVSDVHSSEAELRKDYERRLGEAESPELQNEYLYYLVSTSANHGSQGLAEQLKQIIGESTLQNETRRHLFEDVDRLPHVANGAVSEASA